MSSEEHVMKTNNKTSTTTPSCSSIATTTSTTLTTNNHHHHHHLYYEVNSTTIGRNYEDDNNREQQQERKEEGPVLREKTPEEGFSVCHFSTPRSTMKHDNTHRTDETDVAKDHDGICKKDKLRGSESIHGPANMEPQQQTSPPSVFACNDHSLPLPIASEDSDCSDTEKSNNQDETTTSLKSQVPTRPRTLLTVSTTMESQRSAKAVLHGSLPSNTNVLSSTHTKLHNLNNLQQSPPPPPTFPTLSPPPGVIQTAHHGMATPTRMFPFSFTSSKHNPQHASLPHFEPPCNIPLDAQSCTSSSSNVTQGTTEEKQTKNRKEKSLTMICSKFIQFYENTLKTSSNTSVTNNPSKGEIKIEEAVNTLGIEKRRIYDILNVLESISIVSKVGVSCYKYHGTKSLTTTLEQMKNSAFEDATLLEGLKALPKTPQNEPLLQCLPKFKQNINPIGSSRSNTLTSLSRLLIMSFLVTEMKEMTQDQLASIVLKDSTEKTRTRRLNDIVNILSAINLIEKRSEKSVNYFKWLAKLPKPETTNAIFSPSKMPIKKRKRTSSKLASTSSVEDHSSPCSDDSTSPSSTFSFIDTPQSSNSSMENDSASPSYSSSSQSSTPYSPFFHTTVTTPTASSSISIHNSGGLHFQFRSPPSKKNKPSPMPLTSTVPTSLSKNLHEMFNVKPTTEKKPPSTSPQQLLSSSTVTPNQHKNLTVSIPSKPLSSNLPISNSSNPQQPSSKASPFVTTLGSFRFATDNLQTLSNISKPNAATPCSVSPLAILTNEKNKENCVSSPLLQNSAEKGTSLSPSPPLNPSKGSFTIKIRSPLQPLSPSKLSVLNQQQNIQKEQLKKK
ncbi:hypothetical protein FDP41_006453 [Naegleria fowleri]|uniref:E2F/DP family winged-helix DNA-binding domain-containing protein n=1 Tax=Naegleria fowleri TaxID=5763 RepID=A0A6A5BJ43_NAEFO|nr:uncharacterized protein FDP41_006453 [Naegleria fowleri]KAF0974421.1 hypothetical protein FDP41_006453 [Naegleria fowleri]